MLPDGDFTQENINSCSDICAVNSFDSRMYWSTASGNDDDIGMLFFYNFRRQCKTSINRYSKRFHFIMLPNGKR